MLGAMRGRRVALVLGIAAVVAAAGPAQADYADEAAAARKVAVGTLDRTRRAIAIGPHVGGLGGASLDGDAVSGVSFGLALYTFDIPSALDLQELVAARVRARVQARVKEIVAAGGAPPTPAELATMAREVAAEVVAEVSGPIHRRTLETPRFGLTLEGLVYHGNGFEPAGGGFGARVGVSKGVKKVSVGLSATVVRAGGDTRALLGAEVGVRLTPIGLARTPVAELYVRGDVGFDEGDHPVMIVGGGRLLLDLL